MKNNTNSDNHVDSAVKQLTKNHYEIISSQNKLVYSIKKTPNANVWSCECAVFLNKLRNGKDKTCRHIKQIQKMTEDKVFFEQKHVDASSPICVFCESSFVIKSGTRLHKDNTKRQLYRCKICKHRFSDRTDGFWHMHTHPRIISDSLNLAMSGMSYRKISEHIKYSTGKIISHVSVGTWIARYTEMISEYVNQLNPILGDTWSLDEMMLNVKNTKKMGKGFYDWLWSAIDPKTRFLIATKISKGRHISDATSILELLKENAGKKPDYIVTDQLPAYDSAIRDFGEGKIQHVTSKSIKDTYTNMPIERYHNELRENLKSRRGLGNDDSAQIYAELLRIHHNFIRPHMGLDGKTPSEEAGLKGFADTKYLGIIKKTHNAKTGHDKQHIETLGDLIEHVKIINEQYRTRIFPVRWLENATWSEINAILCGMGFVWLFDNHNRCWVRMGNRKQILKKRRIRRTNKGAVSCKSNNNYTDIIQVPQEIGHESS